jgi:nucleolar GTP-binding protein
LDDFPRVDDIHPFYSDLLNVLYDKDHYKLALGQLNTARNIIDKIAKDYVKLLKYGDSLYRCKQLKRAALGRMCTIMKKHAASLAYLEQVRQHMSRLPSIDPNTRTILVCGYPNVGKSSFMNKVTRADVEVQPYAFTTKSIYVGHTDYKYLRWQVLDTPGILDRPLEERNTIEMQSITAMAHLRAVVLYIVDASEQCGYTIKQQSDLFHSIKPLFANKPLVVAINKTDVRKLEDLKPEDAALIDAMRDAARGPASLRMEGDDEDDLPTMSTLNEEGVSLVKQVCCDKLLAARVEQKLASRRAGEVLNRLHVAQPKPRDAVARPAVIPHSVALNRLKKADGSLKIVTEKELQDLNGGAGVYSADLRKDYQLDDDSWKYDIMPEIFNGKNVADFIDPEIDERLAELEREEDELEAAFAEEKAQTEMEAEPDMDDEEKALLKEVRGRRKELVETHRRKKSAGNNAPTLPRTVSASHADPAKRATTKRMKESLEAMGVDPSRAIARARDRSVAREGRLRKRSRSAAETDEAMDDDEEKPRKHSSKSRSVSVARRVDRADRSKSVGLRDDDERMRAQKMADKAQRKMNKRAKIGEADRTIITKMPKHLFSGKRGIGKTDRR